MRIHKQDKLELYNTQTVLIVQGIGFLERATLGPNASLVIADSSNRGRGYEEAQRTDYSDFVSRNVCNHFEHIYSSIGQTKIPYGKGKLFSLWAIRQLHITVGTMYSVLRRSSENLS